MLSFHENRKRFCNLILAVYKTMLCKQAGNIYSGLNGFVDNLSEFKLKTK